MKFLAHIFNIKHYGVYYSIAPLLKPYLCFLFCQEFYFMLNSFQATEEFLY